MTKTLAGKWINVPLLESSFGVLCIMIIMK